MILDVGSVGDGVEGRAAFAFGGFGACRFQCVEARGLSAFILCSHGGYRIADGLEDAMVKCFRILAKWLVIAFQRLAAQRGGLLRRENKSCVYAHNHNRYVILYSLGTITATASL